MTARSVVREMVRFAALTVAFVAFFAGIAVFGVFFALGLWALLGLVVARS